MNIKTGSKNQNLPGNDELKAVIAAACSAYFDISNAKFKIASLNKPKGMSLWKKAGLAELMLNSDYFKTL